MNNLSNSFTDDDLVQIKAAAREAYLPVVWTEKKALTHFREKITPEMVDSIVSELLAYREASLVPIAVTGEDEISNMKATGLYLRAWPADRQRNEVEGFAISLYTAPQLPVVPDERAEFESFMSERFGDLIDIRRAKNGDQGYMEWDVVVAWIVWQQRAMLAAAPNHSADPTEKANSPVIPDGWALVPIEPTENMIIEGFESEPNESFSEEKVWEAYQAMSGCNQAAYRARLCWAAMLAAAPKPETQP